MSLKKLLHIALSVGVLSLGACSTTGHHAHGLNASDEMAGSGAEASGLGDGNGFGDQGAGPQSAAAKRTYYFDFDRSDVRDSDKPAINANADYLIAHPHTKIVLEGHTDPRGSREYNVALGERRANAVADLLKSRGVNPDQIRVVSYGAERLAAPGHTEADYQLDRRVVLVAERK